MLEAEAEGGGVSGASLASKEWYESFSVASILVCVDMGGMSSPATVDLNKQVSSFNKLKYHDGPQKYCCDALNS